MLLSTFNFAFVSIERNNYTTCTQIRTSLGVAGAFDSSDDMAPIRNRLISAMKELRLLRRSRNRELGRPDPDLSHRVFSVQITDPALFVLAARRNVVDLAESAWAIARLRWHIIGQIDSWKGDGDSFWC